MVVEAIRDDLSDISDNLRGTISPQQLEEQVSSLRQNLARLYQDAEGETKQEWQQFDQELESFEDQLRDNSAQAIRNLTAFLNQLESNLNENIQGEKTN